MTPRKYTHLLVLMGMQAFCTVFFIGDSLHDFFFERGTDRQEKLDWLEYLVTATLFISFAFTAMELKKVIIRNHRLTQQIQIASGAFAEILSAQFESWGLTNAERDVALMTIKGYSIAEIAALRETREGTIKAQNGSIYRKAGVSGRTQLLSLFIDELMNESMIDEAKPKLG